MRLDEEELRRPCAISVGIAAMAGITMLSLDDLDVDVIPLGQAVSCEPAHSIDDGAQVERGKREFDDTM